MFNNFASKQNTNALYFLFKHHYDTNKLTLDENLEFANQDYETVKEFIKQMKDGVMKEAEDLNDQMVEIRMLRQNGTELSLKDYSVTALNYYARFSLV